MVHPPPPKDAIGEPQDDGLGFPEVMSLGILALGKNHTEIALDVHSVAYTPPLTLFSPSPYVDESDDVIAHPALVG